MIERNETMIHNLRALGAVLLALLAMGAVTAATVHAEPTFTLETGGEGEQEFPLDATTEQEIGEESEVFEVNGRNIECRLLHLDGTVTRNALEATLTPDYTDHTEGGTCMASGVLKVTVTENGCDYRFHKNVFDAASNHYKGYLDLKCPMGKQLELHINKLLGGEACTVTVPAQTATNTLTYEPKNKHFDFSGTLQFVTQVHSSSEPLCGFKAGTSQEFPMKYIFKEPVTLTAKEFESEEVIGLTMSGE